MGCAGSGRERQKKEEEAEEDDERRFAQKYMLGKKLGEGAFAQVRALKPRAPQKPNGEDQNGAAEKTNERKLAVKIVNISAVAGKKDMRAMARREVGVWQKVGIDPHCVELVEIFNGRTLCLMVMERCRRSMLEWLDSRPTTAEGDIAKIFREMLMGIRHIHAKDIVHRDIKPDNYLFGSDEDAGLKLADFGLSDTKPSKGNLTGIHGTAPFMSPEMLSEAGYSLGTDVWSFATTCYLVLFGNFPYTPEAKTAQGMKTAIQKGTPEPPFVRAAGSGSPSAPAIDFVRTLLQRNPSQRLSAEEALQLPFLRPKEPKKVELQNGDATDDDGVQRRLSDGGNMRKVLKSARFATLDFQNPADPTVQKGVEQLLAELQRHSALKRSFTTPEADTGTELSLDIADDLQSNPSQDCSEAQPSRQASSSGFVAPKRRLSQLKRSKTSGDAGEGTESDSGGSDCGLLSPLPPRRVSKSGLEPKESTSEAKEEKSIVLDASMYRLPGNGVVSEAPMVPPACPARRKDERLVSKEGMPSARGMHFAD